MHERTIQSFEMGIVLIYYSAGYLVSSYTLVHVSRCMQNKERERKRKWKNKD